MMSPIDDVYFLDSDLIKDLLFSQELVKHWLLTFHNSCFPPFFAGLIEFCDVKN